LATALEAESSARTVLYVAKDNGVVLTDTQLVSRIGDIFDRLWEGGHVNGCFAIEKKEKTFVKLEAEIILDIQFFREIVLVELRMYDIPEG